MRLYEALLKHAQKGIYPCHMPGHKGNPDTGFLGELLKLDITEIDGLDNLHDANGVILRSEEYAADLYGSDTAHFLVGGSTAGILSAVTGVTGRGDTILIGRNCHRSVYNAIEQNSLNCRYLYPEYIEDLNICGMISEKEVYRALNEYSDCAAVVITSPTYEGICSDIGTIAETVHKFGRLLIVDAAHGAHFGLYEDLPENAIKQGADIVIHSVHKTLPAPTQTAIIHLNCCPGCREAVERKLKIYQSSSPSYLLMAGIDNCMSIIKEKGPVLFHDFFERICRLEKDLKDLKKLKHINRGLLKDRYGIFDADPGKIIISVKEAGITGKELYDVLREEYLIQPEMASEDFCLLIMTLMDTDEGFERVKNALICIDEKLSGDYDKQNAETDRDENREDISRLYTKCARQVMPSYQACCGIRQSMDLKEAEGRISAEYISLYPPGVPLLVPGEEISSEHIKGIKKALDMGLTVHGLPGNDRISVLCSAKDILS